VLGARLGMLYTHKIGWDEQLGIYYLFVTAWVRYNRVDLCTRWSFVTKRFVRYNRVLGYKRARYNLVSPSLYAHKLYF
jgi:hypothetical protein